MVKSRLLGAVEIVAVVGGVLAAQAPAPPAFEVASIKLNRSASGVVRPPSLTPGPNGTFNFTLTRVALLELILPIYKVQPYQVIGAPSWQISDRFDIVAKPPEGMKPTADDAAAMWKGLLADRFKLAVHTETRDQPIYALVMARSDRRFGPQFHQSSVDCNGARPTTPQPPQPPNGRPICGVRNFFGNISAGAVTMERFTQLLVSPVGRPVFDRTGLTGRFDFDLLYHPGPDEFPGVNVAALGAAAARGGLSLPPDDSPSIFTAVEEQLGLKLESTRGPVDVLVIDHVEHPTED
jgi:uncharacterized protein (TIGR03435 family)